MKWTAILLATLALVLVTTWCAVLANVAGVQNKDFAAWGQAVGSIFAVGAAIWAAHHATQAQERTAKRVWLDQVGGVVEAILLVANSWREIEKAIDDRDTVRALTLYWANSGADWIPLRRFMKMPIEQWPSAELFSRTAAFDVTLDKYSAAMAEFDTNANRVYPKQADWTKVIATRQAFLDSFQRVIETANKLMKR